MSKFALEEIREQLQHPQKDLPDEWRNYFISLLNYIEMGGDVPKHPYPDQWK